MLGQRPVAHRPSTLGAGARLAAALGVVCTEYLLLGVLFDASAFAAASGWAATLRHVGLLVVVAATALTAWMMARGRALLQSLDGAAPRPLHWAWTGSHLFAFGALLLVSSRLFATPPPTGHAASLLVATWLASGLASLGTLWLGVVRFRPSLSLRADGAPLLAGCLVGGAAFQLAWVWDQSWSHFTQATLLLSAGLLRLVTRVPVEVDPARALLGVNGFRVEVAQTCSGIEGMVLIGLFTTGFLVYFRRRLRFPHALVLLPAGLLLAWTANGVRVAALVAIGAWASPAVALGGFHSKAGWLFFCGLALGLSAMGLRSPWLSRQPPAAGGQTYNPTAAFCVPLLMLLTVGMLSAAFTEAPARLYPLRAVAGTAALVAYRHSLRGLWKAPTWAGPAVGVAVFGLWLWMHPAPTRSAPPSALHLSGMLGGLWLVSRVLGSAVIVPIAEELAFRGFLQRRLVSADFEQVSWRRPTLASVAISALAFGALHPNVVAGALAGAAYSGAAAFRGRLSDAIAAHATTNALLCVWVLAFGRWDLW